MTKELSLYEIYQLILVIEKNSLTEVSEIISVDKSTIRRNIRDIEKKIGTKLFEVNGNQMTFTEAALNLNKKYSKIINDYTHQINKFIHYVERTQDNISIICQPSLSLTLIDNISDLGLLNKINIDFFSNYEIQDTDPKASTLIFEQYDLIISINNIYLLDEYNWLKLPNINSKSHIYAHPDYINSIVTPEKLQELNVYQSSIDAQEVLISYYDGKNTTEHTIKLNPKISSDALLSNIHFASLGYGAVIVPDYLNNLIKKDSNLKRIENISTTAMPINLYYKSELSKEKISTVKAIFNIFNSSEVAY